MTDEVNRTAGLQEAMPDRIDRVVVFGTPAMRMPEACRSEVDVTLFVACYNEQDNIIGTIEEIRTAMNLINITWEAIVIDDASRDRSVELVKEYMKDHPELPLLLAVRRENRGLAQNFIEGAFLGRGLYYRLIMGDNVESGNQIAEILKHIGEADILIPYHAQVFGRTAFRRGLSATFTLLVNLLSGYSITYYNGCSVQRRFDVLRWHVNCYGFDFQANLITRLLDQGRTFIEIPVVGSEREHGHSKALTMKNFLSAARFLVDLAFRRSEKIIRAMGRNTSGTP
jgi:glycosyltransferase involved in cell wall biosynthesis